MNAGPYAEFEPQADLRPWVRLLWRYRDDQPSSTVQRIPPDGCPELIVHFGTPYEERHADGRFVRQPRVIFAGQMTRPLCLRAAGPVNCVGLRFEPDGAGAWLGAAMDTATDMRLDAGARMPGPRDLDAEGAARFLQQAVASALESAGWPLNKELHADIRLQDGGSASAAISAADRRRIQRLYLKQVGVSQRTLLSIFRFRKVFDHAAGADASWLAAALEAGYFDQPQMARDFRRFLDCTATEWAREQVELARSITSPRPVAPDREQSRTAVT